ncbi:hypothetical protein M422DRAFT_199566 [Sphaerobolus stellatus SS14]|nr:hypothetical protein M422DRAFT_199566 [Sphaerobolus stellatus SS14]
MGQASSQASLSSPSASPATCPIDHTLPKSPAQCPVDHNSTAKPPAASSPAPKCPVDHASTPSINPRNQMPTDLTERSVETALPTDRETSTIPRDDGSTWEYPSPAQFHTALARKGMETPEEHVEMMVAIHNWLNEAAWNEVLKWEKKANPEATENIQLTKLRGRPGELSPKARLYMLAGWLLPSRFNSEPPFDRHDWIVRRPKTNEEVRYIIDYYGAPPEPDGTPVFSLDVRPALDSIGSLKTRIQVATEDTWAEFRARESNQSQPKP